MRFFACCCLLLSLIACAGVAPKAEYPTSRLPGDKDAFYGERPGLFGAGGISLFSDKKDKQGGKGARIAVNAYLWRAALDTIAFMPLVNADPVGGTILTDWYAPPEASGERIKVNILILSRELRSDALRVSLFKQIKNGYGDWQDEAPAPGTVTQLENTILARARALKVAQAEK